jgi:hypothetical protein
MPNIPEVRFRRWRGRRETLADLRGVLGPQIQAVTATSTALPSGAVLAPIITTALPDLPPDPLPVPKNDDTISPLGAPPSQPAIVDFHFKDLQKNGNTPIVGRFPVDRILRDPGPKELMTREKMSSNPDIRWVHLPFNSMIYAQVSPVLTSMPVILYFTELTAFHTGGNQEDL